ncbi:MAG: rhodanese-like domain-containing protein, partial [archaeon]|nr:rhodanese-like domain-containing protein [archaeon]
SSVKAWTDLTDGVNLLTIRKKDGIITANIKKTKQDIVLTIDEEPEHEEFSSEEKISEETVLKQKKGRLKPLDEPPYCLIEVNELYERSGKIDGPAVMIDVRPRREIRANGGKIPNSIIIPLGDLMNSIEDIEEYKEEEIVTICHSGARSMMAAQILAKEGFKDIRSLNGGIMIWFNKGYKLEKI